MMKCPACGLYHPPQYEQCISCGANLGGAGAEQSEHRQEDYPLVVTAERPQSTQPEHVEGLQPHVRRSKVVGHAHRSVLPTAVGIVVALTILLVSAGVTIFFLTKPGDDELLLREGQHELANGQYAFAVKTLERVLIMRPNDARIYLSLARAYVGVDQVDKAWDCIAHAQQLGTGVVSEPQLASDLANYYRQRGEHDRAIGLLRPLAEANIPGKRAELADLCALWGDEAIRTGDLDRALKCWEEVRNLRDGTRYLESDARLATIYQKMVGKFISNKDDTRALAFLAKLNIIAANASNYERMAEIYERRGQLEMAIDQLRTAAGLPSKGANLDRRLAAVMAKRGKELLDQGDTAGGYAYLQQARSLDPVNVVPSVTLRSVTIALDPGSGLPRMSGEVWNPGPKEVKFLTLKVELWNTQTEKVVWDREQKLIDEFVPPLQVEGTKPFDVMAGVPVKDDSKTEFRVYLDGGLYKSYPIQSRKAAPEGQSTEPAQTQPQTIKAPLLPALPAPEQSVAPVPAPAAPLAVPPANPPTAAPQAPPAEQVEPKAPEHPENQTLKDLEL
jgi:tetratricopeptide (TPR) repeat protein